MAEKKGFAEYVQRGNNIDFTAADGAEYMQVVSMPGRIGIAMENIQPGGTGCSDPIKLDLVIRVVIYCPDIFMPRNACAYTV